MTEERKYAILFAATLLAARKLMPVLEDETPLTDERFVDLTLWTSRRVGLVACLGGRPPLQQNSLQLFRRVAAKFSPCRLTDVTKLSAFYIFGVPPASHPEGLSHDRFVDK
jgi:hypothetical protein